MNKKQWHLRKYWQGIESALKHKIVFLKESISHSITGSTAEAFFREIISQYIPNKYMVDTGFIVDCKGSISNQIDIIIADTYNIPPLCNESNYKVFTIESVCAVIEVTTGPKNTVGKNSTPKLKSDMTKIAKVRKMGRKRQYVDYFPTTSNGAVVLRNIVIDICPRSFLITAGKEYSKKTYESNIKKYLLDIRETNDDAWLNGMFSVEHGFYYIPPEIDGKCKWFGEDTFLDFILFLNHSIAMYPTYKIDLQRYRSTIPNVDSI